MARPYLAVHFEDNNSKRGEVQVYPGGDGSYGTMAARAAALVPLLAAVSDARITRYELVFRYDYTAGTGPGPGVNLASYVLLFYRNASNVQSVRVPSPGGLPLDATGPYAGVRLSRLSAQVSGLLGTLESIPTGLVDGLGRPYPSTFSVGGRIEL